MNKKFSLQEQALLAQRLALLLKAHVPLLQALSIVEHQTASPAKRALLQRISEDAANGQFLSKSLERLPIFSQFAINIIYIGETSGTLAENLTYLAEELEKKRQLRQKVTGALIYPAFVLLAACAISGFMTLYLFPKLIPVFKSLNVDLPLMTRVLIVVSSTIITHWIAFVIAAIVLAAAFTYSLRLTSIRRALDTYSLKLPIIGPLCMRYHLINMCRTLGVLFKGNVPVLEAVAVAAGTSSNLVYQNALHTLHTSITTGSAIHTHFEKYPAIFPHMLTHMTSIGEMTGNLSDTLLYLAEIYEREFDDQTKRLSSLLEPALMLFIGLLVGFVALSIITPIYAVTQHIK